MSQASQQAAHARKKYKLSTPVDLDVILEKENLELTRFPLKGRVQEIIVGHHIGIKDSITNTRYLRELIAHALGHHFLHAGNQLFSLNRTDLQRTFSQEREAREFAFHVLVPDSELRACLAQQMDLTEMADHFQVTEIFMQARCESLSLGRNLA